MAVLKPKRETGAVPGEDAPWLVTWVVNDDGTFGKHNRKRDGHGNGTKHYVIHAQTAWKAYHRARLCFELPPYSSCYIYRP